MKKFNNTIVENNQSERPSVFCFVITLLHAQDPFSGSLPPFLVNGFLIASLKSQVTPQVFKHHAIGLLSFGY